MGKLRNPTSRINGSKLLSVGARGRNRTGMPVIHEAADFKSDVSTYFTTRAWTENGGATQSRTGLDGFAIRCITDLLSRQIFLTKKGSSGFPFLLQFGAGKETRTLDLNLGKVALYQLSYSRVSSLRL